MKATTPMTRDAVFRRVAELIHEIAGMPLEEITEEATIDGSLEMTSVVFVELQVTLEDELDILLDPIEIVELNRLGDIVDYIHRCAESRT